MSKVKLTPAYQRERILLSPGKTEAVILAAHGFSYKYISQVTHLSEGRVKTLCRHFNVKVTDFRMGRTSFAQQVRRNVNQLTEEFLINHLNHQKLTQNQTVNPNVNFDQAVKVNRKAIIKNGVG